MLIGDMLRGLFLLFVLMMIILNFYLRREERRKLEMKRYAIDNKRSIRISSPKEKKMCEEHILKSIAEEMNSIQEESD